MHETVLRHEAVAGLALKKDGIYIDATFGRGGHTRSILSELGPQGRVLGIDQDPTAVSEGEKLAAQESRFQIARASFTALADLVATRDWNGAVDGILLDLGVSSPQLDVPERGFSFRFDGPLDMRMDPDSGQPAAAWLARASINDMTRVFKDFGEERFAKRIATAIASAREEADITRTKQLVHIIEQAIPFREKHKHPATRVFQAIRIFINDELGALQDVLNQSVNVLKPGGRLVVISFHSLEDRIVKRFMRDQCREDVPKGVAIPQDQITVKFKVVGKAVKASDTEVSENPRARSAVMRVGEKLK
jgi:16S rRNA (cytosine1402-N4)-methyltransferase